MISAIFFFCKWGCCVLRYKTQQTNGNVQYFTGEHHHCLFHNPSTFKIISLLMTVLSRKRLNKKYSLWPMTLFHDRFRRKDWLRLSVVISCDSTSLKIFKAHVYMYNTCCWFERLCRDKAINKKSQTYGIYLCWMHLWSFREELKKAKLPVWDDRMQTLPPPCTISSPPPTKKNYKKHQNPQVWCERALQLCLVCTNKRLH